MERDMKELLVEYTLGHLSGELEQYVRSRIEKDPNLKKEHDQMKDVLQAYDGLPESSLPTDMREEFNALFEEEIRTESSPKGRIVALDVFMKVAASLLFIAVAIWIGWYISNRQNADQIRELQEEVALTKEVVLDMMNTSSASTRIRGVNSTTDMRVFDDEVLSALFFTLNFDDNTNVRLAALNALSKFGDEQRVRSELIKSLKFQDNATIQVALIELLVEIREQSAIESLQELIQKENTEDFVKEEAQMGIFKLS